MDAENKESSGDSGTPPRGRGRCTIADLYDPHRARGAAGLLASAIKAGYVDLFAIDYYETKKAAERLRDSKDPRASAAGTRLCWALAMHDLRMLAVADKAKRLDDGDPTALVDHRGHVSIGVVRDDLERMAHNPEAMEAAVALRRALAPKRLPAGTNGTSNGHAH